MKTVRVLVIAFLTLHFIDFLTTLYAVHINNPRYLFEEKNLLIKNIVEQSPVTFTLYHIFTNIYFATLVKGIRWLEKRTRKNVISKILTILIGIKCFVLLNNFAVLFFVFFG